MTPLFARPMFRSALWAMLPLWAFSTASNAQSVAHNPNLPLAYGTEIITQHGQNQAHNPVQRGTILMHKTTAYQPPEPEESVSDIVERITTKAIAASEARQNQKLAATKIALENFSTQRVQQMAEEVRQFSAQNTTASAEQLRAFTEQRASAMAAELRQYASNNAELTANQLRQYADDVAKRVSKQTVVGADPQVMDAIRKVVNLAIVEQDDPVRYSVERLVEERLARATQDPVEASILRITQPALIEAEQRFNAQSEQQIAQMRQNTEDLLALYRSTVSEQVTKSELNTANRLSAEQAARQEALSRLQSDLALQIQQQNALLSNYQATLSDKLSSQQVSQIQQINALQNQLTQELSKQQLTNQQHLAAVEIARTRDAANIQTTLNQRLTQQQLALKDVRIDTAKSAAEQISQINAVQNQLNQQLAALKQSQQLQLASERQARTEQLAAAEIARTRDAANIQTALNQRLTQQQLALKDVEFNTAQNTAAQIAALENKTLAEINKERAARTTELTELRRTTDLRLASLAEDTRNHVAAVTQASSNALETRLTNYAQIELNDLETRLADTITSAARQSALTADEIRARTATQLDALAALTEERIASVTAAKAIEIEDRLVAYATDKAITEANRVQISEADIEKIAGRTLSEAGDEIRALALQTIAESDDYIKTVAREAIIDNDPAMQTALNNAARKVITDGNDNVTFAIRAAVEDALNTLPPTQSTTDTTVPSYSASAAPTIVSGEEIASANLKIGELQPVNSYGIPVAGTNNASGEISLQRPRHRRDWVDIREYNVVIHEDNKTLEQLLNATLQRAEPFTGPWAIKWKISRKNQDILTERFSLDVETNFTDFIAYLAQYMVNYRGVQLTFSLFDTERTIVISD